jgi:hypothetical protein
VLIQHLEEETSPAPLPSEHKEPLLPTLETGRTMPPPLVSRGPILSSKVSKTEYSSHLDHVGRIPVAFGAS